MHMGELKSFPIALMTCSIAILFCIKFICFFHKSISSLRTIVGAETTQICKSGKTLDTENGSEISI